MLKIQFRIDNLLTKKFTKYLFILKNSQNISNYFKKSILVKKFCNIEIILEISQKLKKNINLKLKFFSVNNFSLN